jgi:hypothetical protein
MANKFSNYVAPNAFVNALEIISLVAIYVGWE